MGLGFVDVDIDGRDEFGEILNESADLNMIGFTFSLLGLWARKLIRESKTFCCGSDDVILIS